MGKGGEAPDKHRDAALRNDQHLGHPETLIVVATLGRRASRPWRAVHSFTFQRLKRLLSDVLVTQAGDVVFGARAPPWRLRTRIQGESPSRHAQDEGERGRYGRQSCGLPYDTCAISNLKSGPSASLVRAHVHCTYGAPPQP